MKILVTGVNGQLGYDVIEQLRTSGYDEIEGIDINNLDITDKDEVDLFFSSRKFDVIIHCAAYTQVDNAEEDEQRCYQVNVLGTKFLVEQAKISGSKFIYISTDYVFDGKKEGQYDEHDIPNPLSVYGKTKYLGELEVLKIERSFIVRISWVFGKNGKNFVKTVIRLSKENQHLNIVNDQIGSPTYTKDLSRLLVDMMLTDKYGIYHVTNEGTCSWYEFAKEILRIINSEIPISPINSEQFKTKAIRPKNSSLSKNKLISNGFYPLPTWKDALERYIKHEINDQLK